MRPKITPRLMREEEHPFERRGRGPSLMRPFILAALMGVGSTLAAIGAIWLMQPSLILKRAPIGETRTTMAC